MLAYSEPPLLGKGVLVKVINISQERGMEHWSVKVKHKQAQMRAYNGLLKEPQ